jgi:flagellar export protein FliJ
MKTLKTLIRLKKDEVDELKKQLAEMENRQQVLKDEHRDLGLALEREAEFASNFPESLQAFADFTKKTLKRQEALMHTIEAMQKAIDKKRDELQEAFGELKKFEIVLEQRQLALFEEAKKRESKLMDDVAIRGFMRKDS